MTKPAAKNTDEEESSPDEQEHDEPAEETEDSGGDAAAEEDEATGDEEGAAPEATDDEDSILASLRRWSKGEALSKPAALLLGLILPGVMLIANMWRVRAFTIDDAYISYRYARNFARGLGLVYNEGERIEGYTNFLWTVLLGIGFKLGIEPDKLAKILGSLAALGTLYFVYRLAERLKPYTTIPCVATWLCATTIVFSGYAVFGLETMGFVFLIVAGTYLFFDEEPAFGGSAVRYLPRTKIEIPYSGVVFALAGLTRPEAPAFIGILALFLGPSKLLGRRNLIRGALFVAPIALHMLWRHHYYGGWVPNTLGAKTGNLEGQAHAGVSYIESYVAQAGPLMWIGLLGIATGIVKARRDLLAVSAITAFVLAYVIIVGGDWMPFFRFMAPFEPFAFLLVDFGVRDVGDRRDWAGNLALAGFTIAMAFVRGDSLRTAQHQFLEKEKRFWDSAAGGTAKWFETSHAKRGAIAIGDIGEVGYKTDFPILDLLGLVDPVISKLPGGYTQKLGPGFLDRFFSQMPEYALIISSSVDCQHPSVPGSQYIYRDRRFLPAYEIGGKVPLDGGFAWCIYKKKGF